MAFLALPRSLLAGFGALAQLLPSHLLDPNGEAFIHIVERGEIALRIDAALAAQACAHRFDVRAKFSQYLHQLKNIARRP
jgi:hypothetical protein